VSEGDDLEWDRGGADPPPSSDPGRCLSLRFEYAWQTDRGRSRPLNEDAVRVDADQGVLVVADGIGGASAGEVASAVAVEVISARLRESRMPGGGAQALESALVSAVQGANQTIWRLSSVEPELSGMGTTVVAGAIAGDALAFAHVGDSRLYRLRGSQLDQLSHDHSFIQEVVDQGFFQTRADARRYGIGDNILTRALGSARDVEVSSGVVVLEPGDLYLFCTDGLTGMVPEPWLARVLVANGGHALEAAADALVTLANERGGTDNITLALLRVSREPVRPGPLDRADPRAD
jgi:protein phosphatase